MAEITQNDITWPEADHTPHGQYVVNRVICQKGVLRLVKSGTERWLLTCCDGWFLQWHCQWRLKVTAFEILRCNFLVGIYTKICHNKYLKKLVFTSDVFVILYGSFIVSFNRFILLDLWKQREVLGKVWAILSNLLYPNFIIHAWINKCYMKYIYWYLL